MRPIFRRKVVWIPKDMITAYEEQMLEIFGSGHELGTYIPVFYGHLARMGEGIFKRLFG